MPVVGIWVMGMAMGDRLMLVFMGMPHPRSNRLGMFVLVVLVVDMRVFMLYRLMGMKMGMALCQMKPHTNCHQAAGDHESRADGLPQQEDRNGRTKKRGQGKIRACSGGS